MLENVERAIAFLIGVFKIVLLVACFVFLFYMGSYVVVDVKQEMQNESFCRQYGDEIDFSVLPLKCYQFYNIKP